MKIIATDFDGTLSYNGKISEEDKAAIKRFRDAGNKFGVVTGRDIEMSFWVRNAFPDVDFIISCTGGVITDDKGKIIYEKKQIADYKAQTEKLLAELEQTKIEAEIKVGLLAEKALDVDYLAFKLKEKGELALDENGKIKGWEDKVAALKTQLPNQFESAATKKIIENRLPEGEADNTNNPKSMEEALKMHYEQKI